MEWTLDDPALLPAADPMSSVRLEFDTGTVEGYLLREVESGVPGVRMMTYALTGITSEMEGAKSVKVVAGKYVASFQLDGFANSFPVLLDCAAGKI